MKPSEGHIPIDEGIGRWLVARRQRLFVAALIALLLLGPGVLRMDFDSSLSVLLPANDPRVNEREALQSRFPANQEISFAIAPDNGSVFRPPALYALAELQNRYREIPHASRIDSILNYESPTGEVSLVPWPWQNFERFSPEELESFEAQALEDPFVREVMLSPSADLALVTVTLGLRDSSTAQNRDIAEAVHALQSELQQAHPGVAIHSSGAALFEQSTRSAMIDDLSRLLPIVVLLCILFICYCFRSIPAGFAVLGIAVLTVVATVGTLGWLGRPFNTISIMAPLVVIIIAVADAVHILSVYRQRRSRNAEPMAAMSHSLAFNMRPVSLATITTAIGFASLMLVSAPALSDFGSTVALGVVLAWLTTFMMLPAFVLFFASLGYDAPRVQETRFTGTAVRWAQRLFRHHDRTVFRTCASVGLLGLALLSLNEIDFDRMDFISRDSPLHGYFEVLNERTDRGPTLNYGVTGNTARLQRTVTDPAFLRELDRFAEWLRAQPEVNSVVSLVEVVRTINEALEGGDAEGQYRIPESEEQVRQHLSDYRQVQTESFRVANFVSDDLSTLRLFITTRFLSNRELVELDQRINENFPQQMPGAELLHGSSTLLFARMDQSVTTELLRGYALSLLMITLTLIVGLRSLFYGLLSIVPNVMPAVIAFGAWGLLVGQIDPFVLMLFSVSIGLVVDDTVHVLSTWLRLRGASRDSGEALMGSIARAGPALMITTAVLALGALVMIGASTLYFQQAAQLLVPIVLLALILDLTFLPNLIRRLEKRRRHGTGDTVSER